MQAKEFFLLMEQKEAKKKLLEKYKSKACKIILFTFASHLQAFLIFLGTLILEMSNRIEQCQTEVKVLLE